MAKQYSNSSSIDTNSFIKGMVKDLFASFQPKENWSHARNAYNNSVDGDTGVIGNEPANLQCGIVPYTIIGFIHKRADQWYVFSTDDTNSEIGFYDESTCSYTTIVNNPCLNFNRKYLIIGASKENYDCTWQIYWDDSNNPSRTLNADDIPWVQQVVSPPGADCVIYADTDVLDCERLRLAPVVDTPCIKLTRAQDGGLLRNGTYQAFLAYVENDQVVTDYIGISNLQSLFNHDNNAGSLNIEITNLDKDYFYYQLVILSNNQQNIVAKVIGTYSTEQSVISLDYIDPATVSVDFTVLFTRKPAYEKSDAMYVVNDYLIRQGPTEQFDFNYQPIANQIQVQWVVAEYPQSYYYKGGNKTSFLRDEVYSFFIRWIYNTGEKSKSYHIPGRPPRLAGEDQYGNVVNEIGLSGGINTIDGPNYNFEIFNTATIISLATQTLPDGGIIVGRGDLAYWQSTEIYPASKPEIWNSTYVDPNTGVNIGGTTNQQFDLCGKPIRHHKMPTEEKSPVLGLYNQSSDSIRILGVDFRNIGRPKFNDGTYIPNVVGYEILRGSREGAKSILAKGVFRNMREYTIPQGQNNIQGLYPNYPYNDLRPDIYFHDGASGVGPAKRTDGCDDLTNSVASFLPITGYSQSVFTFHSPELMFKRPFLNAYEARIYGQLSGQSEGYFIASEQHPQYKLLRNVAAILSGIIGIGYAINAIQGVRKDKINYAFPTWEAGNASSWTFAGPAGAGLTLPQQTANVLLATPIITAINTLGNPGEILTDSAFAVGALLAGTGVRQLANTQQATVQSLLGLSPLIRGGSLEKEFNLDSNTGGLPSLIQGLLGAYTARQKIAEGAQEIIDLMYNFVQPSDFAFKHNSHADIFNYASTIFGNRYRSRIKEQNYIGSAFQIFDSQYKINNLFRPKTVAISIANTFNDPTVTDVSRYVIGGGYNATATSIVPSNNFLETPGVSRLTDVSMLYGALKFNFQNQYGQIEGIKQVPMRGCINFLDPTKPDIFKYRSEIFFSGDTYVGRYTEKVIMPIFSDFLFGQPDGYTYNYLKRVNIPYPRFWMNTQKFDTTKLADAIMTLGISSALNTGSADGLLPNDLYYLDRGNSCNVFATLFSGNDPNPKFAMRYAYMYTHCNGVLDFFTESEINLVQRDWEDRKKDRHYDSYEYNNVDDLFDAEIIKEDNFYKYDYSLSASRFVTNLTSFGEIQTRDYNPQIAETCFDYYPKRLIYSLQAQEEAKKDFWRVFLPNNYKDFKDKVSVIKPINKNGAIIFFPYQSPQMFQGVDTLQTDLGTKITIGDGGLFEQPFQNVANSDLPNEYGSCESARTIINTPLGLFYLSQAQGKVFQYADGLENIANRGMKWWFNKYLPSVLIREFPELEETPLADNTVIGVGCQAVYDINDDIVYFCKKDYSVKPQYKSGMRFDPVSYRFIYTYPSGLEISIELGDPFYFDDACWTVSYDPKSKAWISFHDWCPELTIPSINHFLTTKTINSEEPYCPPGYAYNPSTGDCEKLIDESAPAVVTVDQIEALITGGPQECLIDVIIAVDTSGSTGGPGGPTNPIGQAELTFVTEFINNSNIQSGLIGGFIQIGITSWSNVVPPVLNNVSMNPNGFSMSNTLTATQVNTWLTANWQMGGTEIPPALAFAENRLNAKVSSQLGDRSSLPNFRQYIILVTDTNTYPGLDVGCGYQSSTLGGSCVGPAKQFVMAVYASPNNPPIPTAGYLEEITCDQPQLQFAVSGVDLPGIAVVAEAVIEKTCGENYECNCPPGYTLVYPSTATPPIRWTLANGECFPNGQGTYAPICRKVTCNCPPPPVPWAQTTTTGQCDNLYLTGPNGDPDYINMNPLICNYFSLETTPPSFRVGSIWRHNYRCDLYANYYGDDYPWEVELIENTGQIVNTVRSVEYQLESYVYKGDLYHGCGDDRWHDLDFNFDEAILYNTEQVSGLLRLELNPKEDPYNILQYPIIGTSDIRILYSKEEQKYRFNQFWDITNDRGEFTNSEQEIFITRLNGYIRDLNANNLNYQKPEEQRKKLRHYYNKLILRRKNSGNRKMLLKLNNTKLLLSLR
jgi:hypothetical protein